MAQQHAVDDGQAQAGTVGLPARRVEAGERLHQLFDLFRRHARAVVVITAGFAETGKEGAEVERELARIAADAGITLIGPNCVGIASNERDLFITGFIVNRAPRIDGVTAFDSTAWRPR